MGLIIKRWGLILPEVVKGFMYFFSTLITISLFFRQGNSKNQECGLSTLGRTVMVNKKVHPYIPNSVEEVKREMLKELGIKNSEDIFDAIPDHLRFRGKMDIPKPILSEARLRKHVEGILKKNKNCKDNISFLGGGCWQHYVPSVCDTIVSRDEFLTSYVGEAYSDHGKFQALFETANTIIKKAEWT